MEMKSIETPPETLAKQSISKLKIKYRILENKEGDLYWEKNGLPTFQKIVYLKKHLIDFFTLADPTECVAVKLKWKETSETKKVTSFVIIQNDGTFLDLFAKTKNLGAGGTGKAFSIINVNKEIFAMKYGYNARDYIKIDRKTVEDKKKEEALREYYAIKNNAEVNKDSENFTLIKEALQSEKNTKQDFERELYNLNEIHKLFRGKLALQDKPRLIGSVIRGYDERLEQDIGRIPMFVGSLYDGDANFKNNVDGNFKKVSENKEAVSIPSQWGINNFTKSLLNLVLTLKTLHFKNIFIGDIKPPNIFRNDKDYRFLFADLSNLWIKARFENPVTFNVKEYNYFTGTMFQFNEPDANDLQNIISINKIDEMCAIRAAMDIFALGISILKMIVPPGPSYDHSEGEEWIFYDDLLDEEEVENIKKLIENKIKDAFEDNLTKELYVDLLVSMLDPDRDERATAEVVFNKLEEIEAYLRNKL